MPEAITKYALNSTLGTPKFKPLDKLKKVVSSDNLLFYLAKDCDSAISPSNLLLAPNFEFKSQISGTIKIKAKVSTSEGTTVSVFVDSVLFVTEALSVTEELDCEIQVNENSVVKLLFDAEFIPEYIGVYGDLVDVSAFTPKKVKIKDVEYFVSENGAVVNKSDAVSRGALFIIDDINGVPVKEIGSYAFSYANLNNIVIPDSIQYIDASAFEFCQNLQSVFLPKSISTIQPLAFDGCDVLEEINVEWAEGEVEGANWGAPRATVNYNQTR